MTRMPIASARALLARIQAEELRLTTKVEKDPSWLVLPLALRDQLRIRHSIFERYHALERPSAIDAEKLAGEASMKLRNFYRLYKAWASGSRTPLDLIPYQGLRGERKSKLANPETAMAIRTLIAEVLDDEPMAPPRKVIRHVKQNWDRPEKLPSDVTLRNFHDKAVRDRKLEPGSLTINFSELPQEEAVQATTFGEVLVIDHTAPAKVLVDGELVMSPTITLAIDLWSGLPLGFAVSVEAPDTKAVTDALWDAQNRLKALLKTDKTVRPKILYASTFERKWDDFRSWFLKHDYDLIERRDVHLHHGGPIKRIIGSKLGDFVLQPKLAGRPNNTGFIDADTTALLSLDQVHHILDVTIEKALVQGFADLGSETGALLDIPPRINAAQGPGGVPKPGGQKPSVDINRILRQTRELVGDQLVVAQLTEVNREGREFHIQVKIGDRSRRASTWLALAAEAISIHKEHGIAVQFDVVAEKERKVRTSNKPKGTGHSRAGSH